MTALEQFDAQRRHAAQKHLESFRRRLGYFPLTEANRRFCSDDTLLRYLCACDSDEEAALAKLQATLRWRGEVIAGGGRLPRCPACEADPTAHCFMHVGADAKGRKVIYSCAGRAANKIVHDNCFHMAFELERLFDGNREPGKITWVIDFNGFSIRDMNPNMGRTAFPMFQGHYPERMGQIVALDPPIMFHGFLKAMHLLIDPVTREKLVFLRGTLARRRYAEEMWSHDPALMSWMEAVERCPGRPASFPSLALSRGLQDQATRATLERCAMLAVTKSVDVAHCQSAPQLSLTASKTDPSSTPSGGMSTTPQPGVHGGWSWFRKRCWCSRRKIATSQADTTFRPASTDTSLLAAEIPQCASARELRKPQPTPHTQNREGGRRKHRSTSCCWVCGL
uniref:CRAL-TRIO domain-containing protein n=1 Tax=Pyrodinium bahamense TaxID=73915 RepID=A0A7S0FDK2_9DINO